MPAIHNHIRRHRPLITPRIQFQLAPRPPLPLITPRMEFDLESLACSSPTGSADSSSHSSSDPGSPIDLSRDMDDDEPELDTDRGSSTLPQSASTTPNAAPALIPKPNGEPGRPRSGGFNLEATLKDVHNWSTKDIDDLNTFLRDEATKTLNTKLCFRSQKKQLVDQICQKASAPEFWPVLLTYENCWPVRSALKMILKYQSEAARRNNFKGMASRLRSAMEGDKRESSVEL